MWSQALGVGTTDLLPLSLCGKALGGKREDVVRTSQSEFQTNNVERAYQYINRNVIMTSPR